MLVVMVKVLLIDGEAGIEEVHVCRETLSVRSPMSHEDSLLLDCARRLFLGRSVEQERHVMTQQSDQYLPQRVSQGFRA